jgi:hypothetical protein
MYIFLRLFVKIKYFLIFMKWKCNIKKNKKDIIRITKIINHDKIKSLYLFRL